MSKKITVTLVAAFSLLSFVVTSCGKAEATFITDDFGVTESSQEQGLVEEESQSLSYYVYVCGAVLEPGVYELAAGSRVLNAIDAAHGFGPDAKEDYYNLAELVRDGQMIYIPTQEEAESFVLESGVSTDGRVNINYASSEELQSIPGIGATRAANIIAYRTEHGLFQSPEDLILVSGIGEATLASILGYVTTN